MKLRRMKSIVVAGALVVVAFSGARASNQITEAIKVQSLEQQVAAQFRAQIAQRFGRVEADFDVSVEQLSFVPPLQAGEKDLRVLSILGLGTQGSQRLDGLFIIDAMVQGQAGIQDRKISGYMKVIGPVIVSRRIMNSGEVIAEESLEEVRMPWRNFPSGASFTHLKDLLGRRLRTYVPAGGILHASIVQAEENVRIGDWVNLTLLSSGGVMIRSKAVSKQAGHIGDAIRVENPDTKKILTGTIVGHQEVEVQL